MFFVILLPLLVVLGVVAIVGPALLPVAVIAGVVLLVVRLRHRHQSHQALMR